MGSFEPGELIADKYRVERVLGQGGFGVVVAAHHVALDRRVALKALLPEVAKKPDAVSRFLREGRAATRIQSEHVVRVLDVGTLEGGNPYLVMEYLEGSDLGQLVKSSGALPAETAVDYVLQACEAIAEAHASGIIHRDLKPANLFLSRRADGTSLVKVLDFGISKLTETGSGADEVGITASAAVVGSPRYMSPEQMRSSRDVGPSTDVWSLGVILYELLSGVPPFAGTSFPEVCIQVVSDTPASLRTHVASIAEGLDHAVLRCLAKKSAERHADVAALAVAIAPYGSPAARASAERIVRVLGGSSSTPGAAREADGGAAASPPEETPVERPAASDSMEEGAPAAISVSRTQPRLGAPVVAIGAVALLAGIGIVYFTRSSTAASPAPEATAPPSTARASAAPPPASASASGAPSAVAIPPVSSAASASASSAAVRPSGGPAIRASAAAAPSATAAPALSASGNSGTGGPEDDRSLFRQRR